MSEQLTQRIAEAIASALADQAYTLRCDGGGWLVVDGDVYLPDVAEAVVAALQLTPRYTWSWPAELTLTKEEPGYGLTCDTYEEAAAEASPYMKIVRSYTTPWIEVQP